MIEQGSAVIQACEKVGVPYPGFAIMRLLLRTLFCNCSFTQVKYDLTDSVSYLNIASVSSR